jgi:hypothetical protein
MFSLLGICGRQPPLKIAAPTNQGFPRCTPVRDLHMAFSLPYAYDYIIQLCTKQTEVIQNHENSDFRDIGKGEALHRKYQRLKLGCDRAYDRSSDQIAVVTWATWVRAWSAVPSLDWQRPCICCAYIRTGVTCKTVNNRYPQGTGLFRQLTV